MLVYLISKKTANGINVSVNTSQIILLLTEFIDIDILI